ncbi:uncharacterized protein BDZ99DRAFT_464627 [Mytilinidion resinicola]|uniref:Uncharacterized protein n=1 Tax=Mytilinidion resinicola TaxID=574789 RepID=A0A6A6YIB8_9PEZI|nr:uncharacterized protein BDZ99DRAFT_464627 [Mytilinidion resinicola]KAF2807715.1 hypothetical protein BDZ99DRAFT_464627 [Mytilinidion resinicola]
MSYPTRTNLSMDDPMRSYMRLSNQQENLRRRLSLQIPSSTPLTAHSPESFGSSPRTSRTSFTNEIYSSSPMSAHPSPTNAAFDHRSMCTDSQSDEGHSLYEINQQIKATLTELLNTDSVKQDDKFRVWIQGRLMDAEMEMRRQRRRRSSVDREIAESIAEHFEHESP